MHDRKNGEKIVMGVYCSVDLKWEKKTKLLHSLEDVMAGRAVMIFSAALTVRSRIFLSAAEQLSYQTTIEWVRMLSTLPV